MRGRRDLVEHTGRTHGWMRDAHTGMRMAVACMCLGTHTHTHTHTHKHTDKHTHTCTHRDAYSGDMHVLRDITRGCVCVRERERERLYAYTHTPAIQEIPCEDQKT